MRPLVGMNSKMNLTSTETAAYLETLRPLVADIADRDLFLLLPYPSLWSARARLAGSNVAWGAQDVHPADGGAHTGDVSAPMLADIGCRFVAVGHHERRRDHGETDVLVAAKAAAVQRWSMTAIVCVGEERRVDREAALIQLDQQLLALGDLDPTRLVIAYEPSWAIGVGARAAPTGWVRSIHAAIRDRLAALGLAAGAIPVIYGGSVSGRGAGAFLRQPGVDGLFVGRQALDPHVFAAIAHTPTPDGPRQKRPSPEGFGPSLRSGRRGPR